MNEGLLTSPEAIRIRDLVENGHGCRREGVTLSGIIGEHPELLAGLDEYVAYTEQRSKQIGRTDEVPPVVHSASSVLSAALAAAAGKPK